MLQIFNRKRTNFYNVLSALYNSPHIRDLVYVRNAPDRQSCPYHLNKITCHIDTCHSGFFFDFGVVDEEDISIWIT